MPVEEFWSGFRPRWRKPSGSACSFSTELLLNRPLGQILSQFNQKDGLTQILGENFEGKIAQGGQFSYLDAAGQTRAGAFTSIRVPKSIELATEEFGLITVKFKDLGATSKISIVFSKITDDEKTWLTSIDALVERISR
ncbi:MAG: hypothetical protein RLZZ590_323 [Actinomycetota bacterium]|jgi:hypothetical protein